jgi:hypothetical protein
MVSGLIGIGVAALGLAAVTAGVVRLQRRRRPDRASLQAQLDMMAAATDPEHRKQD